MKHPRTFSPGTLRAEARPVAFLVGRASTRAARAGTRCRDLAPSDDPPSDRAHACNEVRIEALTALLRCTTGAEYSRVLAEVHLGLSDMPETEEKLKRLVALIPFTEGADRETMLTEALATHANVRSNTDPGTGSYAPAVATLARHLPREETPAMLALLFTASFDHHERAEALAIIAPNLPDAALPSAVAMAMELIPPRPCCGTRRTAALRRGNPTADRPAACNGVRNDDAFSLGSGACAGRASS